MSHISNVTHDGCISLNDWTFIYFKNKNYLLSVLIKLLKKLTFNFINSFNHKLCPINLIFNTKLLLFHQPQIPIFRSKPNSCLLL